MLFNFPPVPKEYDSVFFAEILQRIELHYAELQVPFMILTTLHVAPSKPQEGMVILADGTDWNPGSGAGFYGYYGSSWVKLG